MSTPELSLELDPGTAVVIEQPDVEVEITGLDLEPSSFDNYNVAWRRRLTASMEDLDPVKHVAANNFLSFLDILQKDVAPHHSPVTLAELCPDCSTEEYETNLLISGYLKHIPGVHILDLTNEGSLPMAVFQFKSQPKANPNLTMQIMRTENPYITAGKTTVTYSVTQGVPVNKN